MTTGKFRARRSLDSLGRELGRLPESEHRIGGKGIRTYKIGERSGIMIRLIRPSRTLGAYSHHECPSKF